MEKEQQEIMIKFSMFEQQMQQIYQQLQMIEQGIIELANLNLGLDDLNGQKDKEILAPVGRGIFIKTKLLSEELIVDIGSKNFVKKNISDGKKLIQEQIKKLEEVKEELNNSLGELNDETTKMILEEQGKNK